MRYNKILFAAMLMCCCAAVGGAQVLKRTTTRTETVPFGAGSTFAIVGAPTGDIKIFNSTANTATIESTVEVQAANEADLAGAAALTGFVVQESLGRVSVVSVGADSRRKFTSDEKKLIKRLAGMPYRIDYSIGLPRYANLEIDGGTGAITVLGPEGNHRISGADSDLRITMTGGELTVNLQKGRAHVEVVRSGLRGGGVDVSVIQGQASVLITNQVSADIDATVLRSGRVIVEEKDLRPRDARRPFTDKLVQGRLRSGGAGIKLTVGDGDIWVIPLVE